MLHERSTRIGAARDDVDHAGRQIGVLENFGEQQGCEWGRLCGFEHDRVAARQSRRQLPRCHEQREVPRNDRSDNADWLGCATCEGVFQLVGPAGVVEEVRRCQRDVYIAGFFDGLAAVQRLQHGELTGAFRQQTGDAEDVFGTLFGRHRLPSLFVSMAGGDYGFVYVVLFGEGEIGDAFACGRVCAGNCGIAGFAELAVDEQTVAVAELEDAGGLWGWRVFQGEAGRVGGMERAICAACGWHIGRSLFCARRFSRGLKVLRHDLTVDSKRVRVSAVWTVSTR